MFTFGFIGTGNMGGALACAASRAVERNEIILSNFEIEQATRLAKITNAMLGDNNTVASQSKFVFLGIKPQVMNIVLDGIKDSLLNRMGKVILVSMAAGIKIESIRERLGGDFPIIRIMPNTPVEIGEGMILYDKTDNVTAEEEKEFLEKMRFAGRFDRLPEELIDAGCAVSGCGPAFVYMFIEALINAGISCGLDREKAKIYAAQTLRGAASMVLSIDKEPTVLCKEVCSPGGSTIRGVESFERDGLSKIVYNAVKASFERTKELGK